MEKIQMNNVVLTKNLSNGSQIQVISGDIVQSDVDALILPTNGGGMFGGAVDRVLMRAVGDVFHQPITEKIRAEGSLPNGTVIHARGIQSSAPFGNIVWVVDEVESTVLQILIDAFSQTAGYKKIALPIFRSGVMQMWTGASTQDVVKENAKAVLAFANSPINNLEVIQIVVYSGDPRHDDIVRYLAEIFDNS